MPQSGICLPSTMLSGFVLRVKQLNGESYTLCWSGKFRGKKTALADKLFWPQFHWRTEKWLSELSTHVYLANYRLCCNRELRISVCSCTDVLVVIKLSNGYSCDDSSRSYEIVMGSWLRSICIIWKVSIYYPFAWSEEKPFKFQYDNVQLLPFDCFTLSTKPESMDNGKHMLDCGVTRNKANDYKREKREA